MVRFSDGLRGWRRCACGRVVRKTAVRHALRNGFTVIELLVVVTIIAVLATLLLPVMRVVRDTAVRTECVNNLRQIGMGFQGYARENQGWFPAVWASQWFGLYINTLDTAGFIPVNGWLNRGNGLVRSGVWRCPTLQDGDLGWGSGYGLNESHMFTNSANSTVRALNIQRSADRLLVFETGFTGLTTWPLAWCPQGHGYNWKSPGQHAGIPRHLNGGFFSGVFVDGHAAAISYADGMANQNDMFRHVGN